MTWKTLVAGLKTAILITMKEALQQKAIMICMPGQYKRIWEEGNYKMTEKVLIKNISTLNEMYKIVKVTWKQNLFDKKKAHKEKAEKWLATYDYSKRELSEIAGERKCSFLPEDLLLFIGDAKFKRIKSPRQYQK